VLARQAARDVFEKRLNVTEATDCSGEPKA
jgi:hypothetical protein